MLLGITKYFMYLYFLTFNGVNVQSAQNHGSQYLAVLMDESFFFLIEFKYLLEESDFSIL